MSLRYQVPKIFLLFSTLYTLKRVAGKIYIRFSQWQFSETTALLKMKLEQHDIKYKENSEKNPSPRWDLNPRHSAAKILVLCEHYA